MVKAINLKAADLTINLEGETYRIDFFLGNENETTHRVNGQIKATGYLYGGGLIVCKHDLDTAH